MEKGDSRKRKSIDECESDNEHEGEQQTPSMATMASGGGSLVKRKLALVIGIGGYEFAGQLLNTINDAEDMSSALTSIGFIVTMKLNLKQSEFRHILIDFEDSIQSGDTVLFYFAGHGMQWEVCINIFSTEFFSSQIIYDTYRIRTI